MTSQMTREALAARGLIEITELDGHDDPGVDRIGAEAQLRGARRGRDRARTDLPVVEVMFVIGDQAPELQEPPSLGPLPSTNHVRPVVGPNAIGYPVAWLRGSGRRRDGTTYTFVELSWPHAHAGETLNEHGNTKHQPRTVTPLQVDVAIQRRQREARAALGRPGGPLSGLVENGTLNGPVDDPSFDAATIELWHRHQCGEWVGQMMSNMFFVHVAAQVCRRAAADLEPLMRRLDQAQLASRHGNTLVNWQPPLQEPRPSRIADTIDLPEKHVTIYLPNDLRERQAWRITIADLHGAIEHEELITLGHEPTFGPDVTDVWELESRLEDLLGTEYPTERTAGPRRRPTT